MNFPLRKNLKLSISGSLVLFLSTSALAGFPPSDLSDSKGNTVAWVLTRDTVFSRAANVEQFITCYVLENRAVIANVRTYQDGTLRASDMVPRSMIESAKMGQFREMIKGAAGVEPSDATVTKKAPNGLLRSTYWARESGNDSFELSDTIYDKSGSASLAFKVGGEDAKTLVAALDQLCGDIQ